MQEREQVKRSDIMAAVQAAGLNVSDALYGKVVKDLCVSKGNLWSLRHGPF